MNPESQAEIPTSNQTTSPASKEGGGGARFCGKTRSPVPAVYEKEFPMSCASCNGKIFDKYYMRVDGKSWHEGKLNIPNLIGIFLPLK